MSNLFGGKGVKIPKVTAEPMKVTAAPMEQLSEAAKLNRRLAASMLTRDWGTLTLAKPALLGVSK